MDKSVMEDILDADLALISEMSSKVGLEILDVRSQIHPGNTHAYMTITFVGINVEVSINKAIGMDGYGIIIRTWRHDEKRGVMSKLTYNIDSIETMVRFIVTL